MFLGTKNERQTIKTLKLSFVERRNGLAYLSVDRLNIVEGEDADTVADLSGPPVAVLLDHLDRLSRLKRVTIFRFEKGAKFKIVETLSMTAMTSQTFESWTSYLERQISRLLRSVRIEGDAHLSGDLRFPGLRLPGRR